MIYNESVGLIRDHRTQSCLARKRRCRWMDAKDVLNSDGERWRRERSRKEFGKTKLALFRSPTSIVFSSHVARFFFCFSTGFFAPPHYLVKGCWNGRVCSWNKGNIGGQELKGTAFIWTEQAGLFVQRINVFCAPFLSSSIHELSPTTTLSRRNWSESPRNY